MQERSIYEFESYKKFMAHWFAVEGRRGQLSRAAEMLRCQVSFLSRVIKAEIHLTPDHAFLLTKFWKLDAGEAEFFQALVDHERASEPQYRGFLASKVANLRKNHESLQRRVQKPEFPIDDHQAIYFSAWQWSALHFLVSIPEFQTAKALAGRLGMPEDLILHYLQQLQRIGLVKESGARWEYASGQFHIPKNSPFVSSYHLNWRMRGTLDAQNPLNESVHYTSVLTLSVEDVKRLKEMTLNFISESNQLAKPSNPEECMVLTCDLFKV